MTKQTERVLGIPEATHDPLLAALGMRTPLRTARQGIRTAYHTHRALLGEHTAAIRRYRGGLAAETQSLTALRADLRIRHRLNRSALRAAKLSREGRPIDIMGLLKQLDAANRPIWAIVDPRKPINSANGNVQTRSHEGRIVTEFVHWPSGTTSQLTVDGGPGGNSAYIPSGIPALPKRVRELVRDPRIQRRANRIGILYMPETWTEVQPDPALVVEWKDIPGQFFALAVWGGDRARIMEWVD